MLSNYPSEGSPAVFSLRSKTINPDLLQQPQQPQQCPSESLLVSVDKRPVFRPEQASQLLQGAQHATRASYESVLVRVLRHAREPGAAAFRRLVQQHAEARAEHGGSSHFDATYVTPEEMLCLRAGIESLIDARRQSAGKRGRDGEWEGRVWGQVRVMDARMREHRRDVVTGFRWLFYLARVEAMCVGETKAGRPSKAYLKTVNGILEALGEHEMASMRRVRMMREARRELCGMLCEECGEIE